MSDATDALLDAYYEAAGRWSEPTPGSRLDCEIAAGKLRGHIAVLDARAERAERERDRLHAQLHRIESNTDIESDRLCPVDDKLIAERAANIELVRELKEAKSALEDLRTLRTREAYHEDYGDVLWWTLPVCEPPYVGSTLDENFPDYVTHWTPIVEPFGAEGAADD